ncbi:uncharacterized protein LOC120253705 [Dioscorea cayenensis subsp. rotundata]|uniref:Uncharacterized protein LOC120253705 n=1 Tax=Dioscorea cayennensis subsp. rotundata TaxID=55577 RepID=A0AB40ASI8_DIOCR|nr:uncharacterized protein LOC120253705 [Dioscorea cayenensis subsp. rotundata]
MIQNSVQFDGLADEDPHADLARFIQICSTFKINSVSDDAIRLRLFPFSLRGATYRWFTSLAPWSITTLKEMGEKFLARYFPPSKATRLRQEISSFRQAAGGALSNKLPKEAEELIENMASNECHWSTRQKPPRATGLYEVNESTSLAMKIDALTKRVMENRHATTQCPIFVTPSPPVETVDYVGGGPWGSRNQFGNAYNYGWRGSSNPSWNQGQSQYRPMISKGARFVHNEKKLDEFSTILRNVQASIQSLENQLETRKRGIPSASNDGVAIWEDPNLSDDASKENGRKTVEDSPNSNISSGHEYKPVVSYSSRLKQDKDEAQFKKFLNIFKQLHINITIIEALAQMPKYGKFLKELLTNKRKLEE